MTNFQYYFKDKDFCTTELNRNLAEHLNKHFKSTSTYSLQKEIGNFWKKSYIPTIEEDIEDIKAELKLKYNLEDIEIVYKSVGGEND